MDCVQDLAPILPLSGAVLAVSLAYANLKAFRYGDAVEISAKATLDKLQDNKGPELNMLKRSVSYKALGALAEFKGGNSSNRIFKDAKIRRAHFVYKVLFSKRIDVVLAAVFALIAGLTIVVGSAQSAKIGNWTCICPLFNPVVFYWVLFAGFILTPTFVFVGRWVTSKCGTLEDRLSADLSSMMQTEMTEATIEESGN